MTRLELSGHAIKLDSADTRGLSRHPIQADPGGRA